MMQYNYFESDTGIETCINEHDIDALRGILVGIINRDPTFATSRYEETLDYIGKRVNIWDDKTIELPGEYKVDDREKWDKEYFRKQLAWLLQNYTEHRINQIKIIGEYVYSDTSTWGKEEAENFSHPTMQKNMKMQKSVVGILVMIILAVVIGTVIVLTVNISISAKIILVLIVVGIIAIISLGKVLIQKKKK